MDEKVAPDYAAAHIPVEINSLLREFSQGEQIGEKSRVDDLDEIFKWMRGTINGWYGWANDGKGTFFDFMAVMKSNFDGWKWCVMKQEDMSSTRNPDEKFASITANRIHKSYVWTKTGKTPYQHFANKYNTTRIEKQEYIEALEWVDEHFIVIHPKDRRFRNVIDTFNFYYEKFGVDGFLIDPFKSLKLDDTKRTDWMMDDLFIECKEFALRTNTTFNFIAHPKSMTDTKDKDGRYRVVNQFMVAGGAAWDNNMDSQYSIYRPERHLNPADPKVHFHNLKQRNSEEVLAKRGSYDDIKFDPLTKRYFFNGVCPLSGELYSARYDKFPAVNSSVPVNVTPNLFKDDEAPF
jgi:hypothetical protein